jgi:hypothetical protein
MRFPLSFEGSLPSSGNEKGAPGQPPKPSKLKAIWDIRNAISPQLNGLYKTHKAFRGEDGASRVMMGTSAVRSWWALKSSFRWFVRP